MQMIESVQKKWFLILSLILFFTPALEAQIIKGKKNRAKAEQAIMALKDGALVLRLKTKRNKIEKIQELLTKPDLNGNERKKLEKELETTIKERDEYNTATVAAFNNHYTFSAIYFMPDTSSVTLKKGQKSGIFYNDKLEIDPNVTITQDSFFIVYKGVLDTSTRTGMEALIIMDRRFDIVPSPFPYYVRVNNFWLVLGRIFSPKKAIKRDANAVVKQLDRKLQEYYKETLARR